MVISDPSLAGWLLNSLRSGVIAIDADGAVTAFNPAAQRILGVPLGHPQDALGGDFREVLADWPQVISLLEDALDGLERPTRAELVLPERPGAPEATIGFTLLAVRDAAGALQGAAIQFRDLSAFERDDEQALLRDRLAALGEMAAGLAHELRNPLASMELMAGLLRRRLPEGGEEHALVLDLMAQLRVIAGTLDETLEFVRPVAPEPHEVEPTALLDLAVDRATARHPFPGKVDRAYELGVPAVQGDPEQLLVALTDLVMNAVEAMLEEGSATPRLSLGVRAEIRPQPQAAVRVQENRLPAGADSRVRSEVVLSIADSGPGVPPGLRERIFYPFFTTKDAGSGVGLAKAQKIVTSHGGSIELDSRPRGGATFRVRLPAVRRES
jgi:two-component system sensor histidine kinase AtoS